MKISKNKNIFSENFGVLQLCSSSTRAATGDHYPVFCQVQNITFPRKNNTFIGYYRDKSKLDSDAFNDDLFNALNSYFMNLPKITNNNFDVIFNEFTRIILQIIDRHAPIKNFFVGKRNCLKNRGSLKLFWFLLKKTFSV